MDVPKSIVYANTNFIEIMEVVSMGLMSVLVSLQILQLAATFNLSLKTEKATNVIRDLGKRLGQMFLGDKHSDDND